MKPIFFSVVFSLFLLSCSKEKENVPTLVVGIQNSPSNALLLVADQNKLFDTTKVKVEIKPFQAGKLALQAVLGQANDVDVSVSAETPVVLASLGGNVLRIIGEVVNAKGECRVVVKKANGMDTPEKYFAVPRKLTTSAGGSPEWFTYNFIKKYNLDKSKLTINPMEPANMPTALATGAVDAISIFDPPARLAEKEGGDKVQTFNNLDITSYYILGVKPATLTTKNAPLVELLKGLSKAAEFIKSNPEAAQKIIAERTKLDIGIVQSTWSNYSFELKLTPDLIKLSEAESVWAIETGKYPKETKIPAFSEIITDEILKKVSAQ